MQANTLALSVDSLNNGTTTVEQYERYEEHLNRSLYIGANHRPDARDTIGLYRTFPTKSGNFKGVQKSSIKLTQDFQVPGADGVSTLTAPAIIEINFSFPVGMPVADMLKCRQRAIAIQDNDTVCDGLNVQLMV